jgi:hypothetical protein
VSPWVVVGTKTDLLAYDVEENRDHFFKAGARPLFSST